MLHEEACLMMMPLLLKVLGEAAQYSVGGQVAAEAAEPEVALELDEAVMRLLWP